MSRRGLFILLGILVALGVITALSQRDSSPPTSAGTVLLPGLNDVLNDVERVALQKGGGETVATLEKRGDTWVVAEKAGYAADVGKLRQGLRALGDAKILETKTANPELYGRLGVQDLSAADASGVSVLITAAGGKQFGPVILGNAEGTKQRYARRGAEAQSYLLDRNPDFPKNTSQWVNAQILDVRGERVQQVTIKHPDGETLAVSKSAPPPSDLTQGTVVNFDVANVPKGRELLYAGVANVIGNSLRELNLEDVERADGAAPERPVEIEFKTFDGLVVKAVGTDRGEEHWLTFEASVDPEQAARFAQPAADAAQANAPAADAAATAPVATNDPTAEAARINERVAGWRYKIAGFQYDQMTRRIADLLKPVG
jgi:hypothetical protein